MNSRSYPGEPQLDSAKRLFRTYGFTVLIAVVVAFLIRFFALEAYRIPTSSMHPTLEPGDTIFVAKWPFGFRFPGQEEPFTTGRKPKHGEVVVYIQSNDPPLDAIKRVVALEGDTFEIKKGRIFLNEKDLTIPTSLVGTCGQEAGPESKYGVCWEPPLLQDVPKQKVPSNSVLLVGDFRTQPGDARVQTVWTIAPVSSIKGSALWIWLSIEPPGTRNRSNWFSRIRFERMFREI